MPMQTRRAQAQVPKQKHTARAPKTLTKEQQKQVTALTDSCDECIAKLKFYHMNRTAKGKQEFVDLMVDVLMFTARKHPEDTLKSLNALSYKGKIQLKDTSKDELARFARAAYADTRFMSRRKSEGMIAMSIIGAFFVGRGMPQILATIDLVTTNLLPNFSTVVDSSQIDRYKKELIKNKLITSFINAIVSSLGMGATYIISRPAFQKNVSRLDAIIRKH